MSIPFLNNINLNKNELQNVLLHKLASAPGTPIAGQVYYNTTDNKGYLYDGTKWVEWLDAASIGGGDVSGPSTATDGNIVVFDGASGKTIKDSGKKPSDYQPVSEKGAANGYAGLDANGKVPTAQLPASVTGGMQYKGAWDASTGAYPADPETGWYYVVSVAGTAGGTAYNIGDWAVYNGTSWDKIDNTDSVSSVNGKTGAVVLGAADIDIADSGELFTATTVEAALAEVKGQANALPQIYAANIGNGSSTDIVVTHNLGTRDVLVQVRDNASPYDYVMVDIEATTENTVTLRFAVAPAENAYRCIVMG
jgi:hypothetical protein